jgi:hypothetical protein
VRHSSPFSSPSHYAVRLPRYSFGCSSGSRAPAETRRGAHHGHRVGDAQVVTATTPSMPPSSLPRHQHHLPPLLTPLRCPCLADPQRSNGTDDAPATPVTPKPPSQATSTRPSFARTSPSRTPKPPTRLRQASPSPASGKPSRHPFLPLRRRAPRTSIACARSGPSDPDLTGAWRMHGHVGVHGHVGLPGPPRAPAFSLFLSGHRRAPLGRPICAALHGPGRSRPFL